MLNKQKIKQWQRHKKTLNNYPIAQMQVENFNDVEVETGIALTKTFVFHENLLDTVQVACKLNLNPLVVNVIKGIYPKEQLETGSLGEQYEILRNTNFYLSLDEEQFPLAEDKYIYSSEVALGTSSFSMISFCGLMQPGVRQIREGQVAAEEYINPKDEELWRTKISAVFSLAVKHNHNAIIFSDLGIEQGNPKKIITDMLNDYINSGAVDYVLFSVKHTANPDKDQIFLTYHTNIVKH